MDITVKFMIIYLIFISAVSVILTVVDKLSAKSGLRRIRERTLLCFAFLGGSLAMYIVMRIIRHKTLHNKFMIGLPLIIILQVLSALAVYNIFF